MLYLCTRITLQAFVLAILCVSGLLTMVVSAIGQDPQPTTSVPAQPVPLCESSESICTKNAIHREGKLSHLCVSLRVEQGRLQVKRDKTCFFPRGKLAESLRGSAVSDAQLRTTLFDALDKEFRNWPKLFWLALNDEEKKQLQGKTCADIPDPATKELCDFTNDWEIFREKFNQWRAGKPRRSLEMIFGIGGESGLQENLKGLKQNTPLFFRAPEDSDPFDDKRGLLLLAVTDPIGDLRDASAYRVCVADRCLGSNQGRARTVAKPEEIVKVLQPLVGHFWFKEEIEDLLTEYYAGKGLSATFDISDAEAEPKVIKITESPRIEGINFPPDTKREEIDKVLYLLLPDAQFRYFQAHATERRVFPKPRPIHPIHIRLKNLQPTSRQQAMGNQRQRRDRFTPPYLNVIRFQLQQMQLNALDFAVEPTFKLKTNNHEVILVVSKLESKKDAEKRQAAAATAADSAAAPSSPAAQPAEKKNDKSVILANPSGRLDPNLPLPEKQTRFVPSFSPHARNGADEEPEEPAEETLPTAAPAVTPPVTNSEAAPPPEPGAKKHNYLAGGFEYKSGQGVRGLALYQGSFKGTTVSLQAGGNEKFIVKGNLFWDYLFFGTLKHRVSLQLSGNSDYQARRIFASQETSERRTGGMARVEFEWFRDLNGQLLRLFLEGQRSNVELSRNDKVIGNYHLTTLDIGGLYLLQANYEANYPRWFRVEPRLRFGLGAAADEPRFTAFSLTANFHQKLPHLLEFDFTGRTALMTRATPFFEQAAFGGEEAVRGFRRDEAIGRQMWSIQPELWFPVPGTTTSRGDLPRLLRQSVRLAGFADVGGVYQTTGSQPGIRTGPGLGLRFIFGQAVMKLDWAYGLSRLPHTTGHGRVYFNVGLNLPF